MVGIIILLTITTLGENAGIQPYMEEPTLEILQMIMMLLSSSIVSLSVILFQTPGKRILIHLKNNWKLYTSSIMP
jgi:hypothetical protein